MLHCYAMWSNLSGNPKYAALAQHTPAPFSVMFRWIELVHPRNNYLHKGCLDRSCICAPLALTFGQYTRAFRPEHIQHLYDNPRDLRLILDLWLNATRYFPVTANRAAEMMCNFAAVASSTYHEMRRLEGGDEVFVGQVLRLKGRSRRRTLRALCENMVFLLRLKPSEPMYKAWAAHFDQAQLLLSSPSFYGVAAPKVFVDMSVCAAMYVMQFPGELIMQIAARDAVRMLCSLCSLSPHTCNLNRAIEAGVFELVIGYARTGLSFGETTPAYDLVFADKLAVMLTRATVLRTFHARHSDLLTPESPDAFIEERFARVLGAYRTLWPLYLASRRETLWRLSIPCSNPLPPPHTSSTLRICRCGARAYCSKDCQRADWQRCDHRSTCAHTSREGKPAVERVRLAELSASTNVLFSCRLAQGVIQRNHVSIAMMLHASWRNWMQTLTLTPCMMPLPTVTVDLTDGPPAHRDADDFPFHCEVKVVDLRQKRDWVVSAYRPTLQPVSGAPPEGPVQRRPPLHRKKVENAPMHGHGQPRRPSATSAAIRNQLGGPSGHALSVTLLRALPIQRLPCWRFWSSSARMVALDHKRYLEDIAMLILVSYPGLVALFSNIPQDGWKKQNDIDLYGQYTQYSYL
ncbi:hypothetical protein GGG16DRAFT_118021 [Schizophyllum commune]